MGKMGRKFLTDEELMFSFPCWPTGGGEWLRSEQNPKCYLPGLIKIEESQLMFRRLVCLVAGKIAMIVDCYLC